MLPDRSLRLVKLLHTVVWCFFVVCIIAIPIAGFVGRFDLAFGFIAIVLVEVLVLFLNGFRCPLTDIAARYTDDRRDNFDIYLPEWVARHNKLIFGSLFLAGVAYAIARWLGRLS
jgi:hypothetical protein